jgi:hypothetical protein
MKSNPHNKSLQLSPRRPPDSVHAVLNSMRVLVDAAAQLSSMLDGCSGPANGLRAVTSFTELGHEWADCWPLDVVYVPVG